MSLVQFNLIIATIISVPGLISFQAKRPTNCLYWMVVTIILSNIYFSFEVEGTELILSNHILSNLITITSLIISAIILRIYILRTTNKSTRKIYSSLFISEILIVSLGLSYLLIMNVLPNLLNTQIDLSLFALGTMILILGIALVITENNLFKTGVGLISIQNGVHIILNSLVSISFGTSVLLNFLQIFITIIFVTVISRQYKETGSVLVQDMAILKY